MSNDPPDDNGILPWDWTWGGVGHGALDVLGLVPGVGELADVANAAWYAGEEEYLDAGLSIISMVPIVGDAIGKGGRLVKAGAGKLSGPALKALKNMDFKKVLDNLPSHPKIDPVKDKIVKALEDWRKDLLGEAPATPCKQGCPNAIGKAGEDAVSSVYDIGKKQKFEINGRNRIPDGVTESTLSEVKNVGSLSYTQQLRDFADIAAEQGLVYDLYVRPSTKLSGPLLKAIDDGIINLKLIPGAN